MAKQPKKPAEVVHTRTFTDVKSFFEHQQSGDEFLKIDGFIDRSKQSGSVRLAPNGDCQRWMEIPERSIREIELLREHAPCVTLEDGYHTHAYVRLTVDHGDPMMAKALGGLVRQLLQTGAPRREAAIPSAPARRPGLRYFGRARGSPSAGFVPDNCGDGYKCVYVGTDQCDYGCACVDPDGMGYCSTCCVA